MRILVMEDQFALRDELEALVLSLGHEPVAVSDAIEAVAVLKRTEIDAVITDVYVKHDGEIRREGGVRLIGQIRFSPAGELRIDKKAPILAISGGREVAGGFSPLRTARDVGADSCLRKPLDMEEVALWIMDAEVAVKRPPEPRAAPDD